LLDQEVDAGHLEILYRIPISIGARLRVQRPRERHCVFVDVFSPLNRHQGESITMTRIRVWHSYIGLFIAPSVLFFALTGALQLFNLHEAHGQYVPPAVIEKLSSVHKDQVFVFGKHHAQAQADAASPAVGTVSPAAAKEHGDKSGVWTTVLKGFFLLVAIGLALSTGLGLWMGLSHIRRKRTGWLLVIAGALIPTGLLII
jgi:hypothetical protein